MNCWREYLIGALQGDGSITYNNYKGKRKPSGLSFPIAMKDYPYANRLIDIIKLAYPTSNPKKNYRKDGLITVSFYNTTIAQEMAQYKILGKWFTPDLYFPEYYIAGLWDTDGYIGNTRRLAIEIAVKASDNLRIVKDILTQLGFSRIKIRFKTYENALGQFRSERILIQSKKGSIHFNNSIPIQHYRKQDEIIKKIEDFSKISGRRGHGELREEVIKAVNNKWLSSSEIGKMVKKEATHITKELLKYVNEGYLIRKKVENKYVYTTR